MGGDWNGDTAPPGGPGFPPPSTALLCRVPPWNKARGQQSGFPKTGGPRDRCPPPHSGHELPSRWPGGHRMARAGTEDAEPDDRMLPNTFLGGFLRKGRARGGCEAQGGTLRAGGAGGAPVPATDPAGTGCCSAWGTAAALWGPAPGTRRSCRCACPGVQRLLGVTSVRQDPRGTHGVPGVGGGGGGRAGEVGTGVFGGGGGCGERRVRGIWEGQRGTGYLGRRHLGRGTWERYLGRGCWGPGLPELL